MRLLLLIACLFSSLAGLSAQEKVPKLSTTVYCFRYAPGLQTLHVRTGANSYGEVQLSTANLVGPVQAALIEGKLTFHRQDTDEEGKTIYPVVAMAKVGTIKRPLVILVPAAQDHKLSYRSLVVDRADTKFPMGSYQLVNFAPHPVRAKIGGKMLEAKSSSIQNFKPSGTPGEMMPVLFQYHDGERWRRMTSTRWAYREDRRSLVCAYLDPRDKRMKMRSIPERVREAAPEAP